MHKILILFFSLACNTIAFKSYCQTDSLAKTSKTDSTIIAKKTFKIVLPKHYYIGLDVVKLGYNIFDNQKTRIETFVEAPLKKNNWLVGSIGYANSHIANNAISYKTYSTGLTVGVLKNLFTPMFSTDNDNAFIGLSYGIAQNKITDVQYKINDIWGSSSGSIDNKNVWAHWLELNAGFRIEIKKNLLLSWRIAGKTLINQKALQSIAPLYIAPYGTGDKVGTFGFNFLVLYKLK
jgi:Domain of unknown function (DUF6048)